MATNGRGKFPLSSTWVKRANYKGSLSPLVKSVFPGDTDTAETAIFTDWFFPRGDYNLTALGGSYNLSGQNAIFEYPSKANIIDVVRIPLSTAQNPGAQSIQVPASAQAVIVFTRSASPSVAPLTLTSSFTGTFTLSDLVGSFIYTTSAYATVTATGSQTITPSWGGTHFAAPPEMVVIFLRNINTSNYFVSTDVDISTTPSGAQITLPSTAVNDLFVLGEFYSSSIPSTITGFTSAQTSDVGIDYNIQFKYSTTTGSQNISGTVSATNVGLMGVAIRRNITNTYTLTGLGGAYSLTGQNVSISKHRNLTATGGAYSYTGQTANLTYVRKLTASGGSYSLAGQAATIKRNRTLTSSGGSYTLAGQVATIKRQRNLAASGGSYSYTGQVATIKRNRTLTSSGGSYAYTGGTVNLHRHKNLTASGGSYAITGQPVNLYKHRRLTSSGGSYTVSGQPISILRHKYLSGFGGIYSYSGNSVNLYKHRNLVAQGGIYNYTGQTIGFTHIVSSVFTLNALGGTYTLSGQSAILKHSRLLQASGGSYSYIGQPITLYKRFVLVSNGGNYSITGQNTSSRLNRNLTASGGIYSSTGQSININHNRQLSATGGQYTYTGQTVSIYKHRNLTVLGGSYTSVGQNVNLIKVRRLQVIGGSYTYSGQNVNITKTTFGGYPDPSYVLFGISYGPTGVEYTGTLDIGKDYRIDIATGHIVKILDGTKVMTL